MSKNQYRLMLGLAVVTGLVTHSPYAGEVKKGRVSGMKQKELLDLYSDYLLASFGATTATGLSQLLEGEVSHDQVTRHLSGKKKTAADLWLTVKPFVRQVQSEQGILIIDDSIEEKPYTDENDLVCWHYDHSKDRMLKGINFLTALYIDFLNHLFRWPVPAELRRSKPECLQKGGEAVFDSGEGFIQGKLFA